MLLMRNVMHYVYLIRSVNYPEKTYIGDTENLKQRLETHNSGLPDGAVSEDWVAPFSQKIFGLGSLKCF